MINFLRISLAAAMIVFTLGCVFKNPSYPTSWPQTTGSNDIESRIKGSFNCQGEITVSKLGWKMNSITDFLIDGFNGSPTCRYIEIRRVQPDEMEIRFIGHRDEEVMKRNYKKDGGYYVEGNWIALKPCSWGGASLPILSVAVASFTPYLTIDVNQGLVIRGKTSSVGIFYLLVPIGTFGTEWGRFDRFERKEEDFNVKGSKPPLIISLPNDNSWFTEAKRIALEYGEENSVLGYYWHSKTIYINQEGLSFSIIYAPTKRSWSTYYTVSLSRTHGSLSRYLFFDEYEDVYTLMDKDFREAGQRKQITKEEAEELASNFFKEIQFVESVREE